jgi:hypothetical protein
MQRCVLAGLPSPRFAFLSVSLVVPAGLMAMAVFGAAGCRDSASGAGGGLDGGTRDLGAGSDRGIVGDADCSADGPGGGVCPINFCGYITAATAPSAGALAQGGADSVCNQGRICLATVVVASGTALQLSCLPPRAGGLAYGAACSPDPSGTLRCLDDSLCISSPDAPGAPFCTTLCRNDADCSADSACLEYAQALPNQAHALIGECTPKTKIAGMLCATERDCPAGQGCLRVGARTAVRVCKAGGTKSMGEACTAAGDCRSGECYDREFRNGTANLRAFCSGGCTQNSDCGADQRCVAKVVGNNDTPDDPQDDVVVGYCRSLFASPISVACANSAACVGQGNGADTCHPTYGICYNAAAVVGGPCGSDDACGVGGACAMGPVFAGGGCVLDGCAPTGAAGADLCPGAQSVCSQRASDQPIHRCYEGCTTAGSCSRVAQNYFCAAAQTGQPVSICLSR